MPVAPYIPPIAGRLAEDGSGRHNRQPHRRAHKKHLAWVAAVLLSLNAFAHHGWSWAEEEQTELTGTIESISMSPPHPVLKVKAVDGLWQVDLGNPNQTARSGFTGESAKPGDPIVVLGNRSLEKDKKHMKAVRITVRDRQFDMYPERIKN